MDERNCEKREDGQVPLDPHPAREEPGCERHTCEGDEVRALRTSGRAPQHSLEQLSQKRIPVDAGLVGRVEEVLVRRQEAHDPSGERQVVIGHVPGLRRVVERRDEHRREDRNGQGPECVPHRVRAGSREPHEQEPYHLAAFAGAPLIGSTDMTPFERAIDWTEQSLGLSPAFASRLIETLLTIALIFTLRRVTRRVLARAVTETSTRYLVNKVLAYAFGITGILALLKI